MNAKQEQNKSPRNRILTIPNLMSLFRLCLIPALVWLYVFQGDSRMTAVVLLLSGVTDVADGFIARKFNMVSDLGKALDPIADKLTQAAMLACLLTRYPLMGIPLAVMAVRETYMSISGVIIIRRTGTVLGASWHGKATTVLLYAMMILHVLWAEIPPAASNTLVFLSTAMIVLSFILYALRNTRVLREKREQEAAG